jgi:hypothetical protein
MVVSAIIPGGMAVGRAEPVEDVVLDLEDEDAAAFAFGRRRRRWRVVGPPIGSEQAHRQNCRQDGDLGDPVLHRLPT